MNAPAVPFLASDIVWHEVPIIAWLFAGIATMLITTARFGRGRARDVLHKYRLFWVATLALALVATVVLFVWLREPVAHYL